MGNSLFVSYYNSQIELHQQCVIFILNDSPLYRVSSFYGFTGVGGKIHIGNKSPAKDYWRLPKLDIDNYCD